MPGDLLNTKEVAEQLGINEKQVYTANGTGAGRLAIGILACCTLASASPAFAAQDERTVIVATTTSTQDSGLLDVLVPMFEKETGLVVKTISVGSCQAMAMGKRGEADVLLVHAPADEQKLVAEGTAVNRRLVMHNDFVLLGPPRDPRPPPGREDVARGADEDRQRRRDVRVTRRPVRDARQGEGDLEGRGDRSRGEAPVPADRARDGRHAERRL